MTCHPPFGVRSVRDPLWTCVALVSLFVLGASPALSGETATHRLVLLDGTVVEGRPARIADGQVEYLADRPAVEVDQLRAVERLSESFRRVRFGHELRLAGEGRINASKVSIAEGVVRFDWRYGEGTELPLERVRALRMDAGEGEADPAFAEALAERMREDQIAARQDDRVLMLDGAFTGLDEQGASLVFRDQPRQLSRERFYGVVFAPVAGARENTGARGRNRFLLHLDDGSTMPASKLTLEDGQVAFEFAGARMRAPFEQVSRLEVRSERMAFLSDLEPVEVEQDPGLDLPRPWQRDRNVRGGPITLLMPEEQATTSRSPRLVPQPFDKGLGVRSYSRLVFDIAGEYGTFAATVGIDTMTRGRGEVEMAVTGDGRELWRERIRGGEAGKTILIDVEGVRRLELLVDFGDELSLSGIANWADARLLR